MKADVAVVGNGVAGYACAARLAGHGIRPLLIGPGLPADRPPLTKAALGDGIPRLLADEAKLGELGIDLVEGRVVRADLERGRLQVVSVGGDLEIEADRLVLATGLAYGRPPVPGLAEAFVNAEPSGLVAVGRELSGGPCRVLVVGAGLIGTESAATLASRGHDVTIVDLLERPLDRLHDPLPALALQALETAGARFVGGVRIERFERGTAVTSAHGKLPADIVIAATGGQLDAPPGLPPGLELPLQVDPSMVVDGFDRVHAVGDLVLVPHARFGSIRFPQWDAAIGTGEHAADAIAGVAGDYERLPYWWTDIGALRVAEVGVAALVSEWRVEGDLHVGRDGAGTAVCAMVVDDPRRLREARRLVLEG
jgi:3-phenylpropionate/trans-cinnamate dioxygenase ferredoxin reductase component